MFNQKRLRLALLAGVAVAGLGGIAIAQDATGNATSYDPAQLPAIKGRVAQYSLTPRGDVDGLILDDGTEVHLPPHLGPQLVFAVKPGDAVTIHGLKARDMAMVQAMQVTDDASNQSVTDNGPPAGGPRPPGPGDASQALVAQGTVKEQLHGPRGDLNGVLLQDGTIVRLPPPEAQAHAAALAPGKTLYASGDGMASPLGRVIAARAIGTNAQDTVQIAAPPPHGHDRHGPPPPPR